MVDMSIAMGSGEVQRLRGVAEARVGVAHVGDEKPRHAFARVSASSITHRRHAIVDQ
jgi:hypothetical protein